MRTCLTIALALACAIVFCLAGPKSLCQEKKEGAEKKEADVVITSPKKGEEVEQINQVEGKCHKKGHPVVLVRAASDTEWWVQQPVEDPKDGEFTSAAHFGREGDIDKGVKYRIIILLAPSKEAAQEKFKTGDRMKALPPVSQCPRSEQVEVVRK